VNFVFYCWVDCDLSCHCFGVLVVVVVICYVKITVISQIPNYFSKKITQNAKIFFSLPNSAFTFDKSKALIMSQFYADVCQVVQSIKELLLEKNEKYGNSALEPLGVFSQLSAKEGLLVRIDDKLKRIKNGSLEKDDEDVINDLIGYLVLLKIYTNSEKTNEGPKGVTLVNGKIDINEFF